MRNHTTTAVRADIGRTPQLCQDALIEMLKELFAGKLFCGQEGRKALKIYKQDLPIPRVMMPMWTPTRPRHPTLWCG